MLGGCVLPCILVTDTCRKTEEAQEISKSVLELIESVSTHRGNINVLSQEICDQIKTDNFSNWQSIDNQSFRKCFLYGLNSTIELFLNQAWNEMGKTWGQNFSDTDGDYQNVLLDQNFNANEEVVLKVLELRYFAEL